MATNTAPQVNRKTVAEVRNCAVSFANKLDPGELLTGTPTVTSTPSGPTISGAAVNTAAKTINGVSVPIGMAVQFKVTGGTVDTDYILKAACGTTSSPAQTLEGFMQLEVRNS